MDLHTGNICADRWGYLKLIDFGIALQKNDMIFHALRENELKQGNVYTEKYVEDRVRGSL